MRQAACVGRRHLHGDVRLAFVVERHAVLQLELTVDHLKAGVRHCVSVTVAGIGIDGRQRADHGAGGVLQVPLVFDRAMSVGASFTLSTVIVKLSLRDKPPASVVVT